MGKDPDVKHVGVGENDVAVPTDRGPVFAVGVTVVRVGEDPLHTQRREGTLLVLGQRLGWVDTQCGRGGFFGHGFGDWYLVTQCLSGGGPGDDHRVRSVPDQIYRPSLV